jgi:hypothetical protein
MAIIALTGCSTTHKVISGAKHIWPFHEKAKKKEGVTRTKNMQVTMTLSPLPVKLSDNRQLNVQIRLANLSKKFLQLEFPTTQRIEILVHDENGKLVTQWSEERSFEPQVGVVGINPGEHLEYSTAISTRDMKAGQKYKVTGFFPNFDEFKAEQTITPES